MLTGGAAGLIGGAVPFGHSADLAAIGGHVGVLGGRPRVVDPETGFASLVISHWEFVPFQTSVDLTATNSGVYAANFVTMVGPVQLPPGAMVEQVTFSAVLTTASAALGFNAGLQTLDLGAGLFNIGLGAGLDFDASTDVQTKTAVRQWPVQPDNQLYVRCALDGGTNARLLGARIDYTPAPGPVGFTPVAPFRAYDSRLDMSPEANGRLATGDNRTLSVASARDVITGTVVTPNVIPAHATAVAYNVTIAEPQGAGFLSLTPGDATELGASSINWGPTTAAALANAGVVQLDDQRRVKMFAGGDGSTHSIIDVTGYFSA
ncbi:MAG: hypothetical protein HKN41_13125 [Ilumatobacter sp.]|nr:hypothetical protein [Ilumatobacter sp.]